MNQIGLYIHIPFCKSKCYYCDFNSFSGKSSYMPSYFTALKKEVGLYSQKLSDYKIKTVFIGGGTPSFIDARYLSEVMELCRKKFNFIPDAEISIEANPGTLSGDKLAVYREMGINRLSIGLQAWQDHILKSIGRIHNAAEFVENFKQARKIGFDNINVDLIFGLPGQTIENWAETIEKIIQLNIEHVSCYSLKIEEGTVFGDRLETGEIIPAEDELDREMYYLAIDKLNDAGLGHYEISNFAKKGYECRHNLIYWKAERYLGIGAGAHSYLDGRRFNNIYNIEEYSDHVLQKGIPAENAQTIDIKDEMSEYMILGLRLTQGISRNEFSERYNRDISEVFGKQIDDLKKRKLLLAEGDWIKLSSKGLDLANEVFVEFV